MFKNFKINYKIMRAKGLNNIKNIGYLLNDIDKALTESGKDNIEGKKILDVIWGWLDYTDPNFLIRFYKVNDIDEAIDCLYNDLGEAIEDVDDLPTYILMLKVANNKPEYFTFDSYTKVMEAYDEMNEYYSHCRVDYSINFYEKSMIKEG